eukprot:CAMPEP_0175276214 /NCGR_PEP_ID=MMETSP0093-20121207/48368_1 /TAXON_ID=311494 /ORGANISM="Alexandrium monilatum, Strain CCMP3105" /LENGTH=338 /DNA_ID=CAMNT_0016571113 /DNA_START=68 /DNA_END=1080 /DNA_ORIENTATION=-
MQIWSGALAGTQCMHAAMAATAVTTAAPLSAIERGKVPGLLGARPSGLGVRLANRTVTGLHAGTDADGNLERTPVCQHGLKLLGVAGLGQERRILQAQPECAVALEQHIFPSPAEAQLPELLAPVVKVEVLRSGECRCAGHQHQHPRELVVEKRLRQGCQHSGAKRGAGLIDRKHPRCAGVEQQQRRSPVIEGRLLKLPLAGQEAAPANVDLALEGHDYDGARSHKATDQQTAHIGKPHVVAVIGREALAPEVGAHRKAGREDFVVDASHPGPQRLVFVRVWHVGGGDVPRLKEGDKRRQHVYVADVEGVDRQGLDKQEVHEREGDGAAAKPRHRCAP